MLTTLLSLRIPILVASTTVSTASKSSSLLASIGSIAARTFASLHQASMESGGVVPDVISASPQHACEVTFENGAKADMGNVLTPTQVQNPPVQLSWPTEDGVYYTLIKTDPDAPSRKEPTYREWHHWIVANIPGTKVNEGETLSEYIGAGPPPKTGLHRYVYLVYKQPSKLPFSDVKRLPFSGDDRPNFKAAQFAEKHNLTLWAGNYFQAEYDEYVPKLYAKLGA